MGPFLSGSQIDGATGRVEQPWIGVQLVHCGDNPLVGPRKALGSGKLNELNTACGVRPLWQAGQMNIGGFREVV
jgi:hypothetical protein